MPRKLIYKFPGLILFYHFLWVVLGVLIYGRPDKKIFVIGVTGTKGKSTTLELLNAILEDAGKKTALLSSLRVKIGDMTEKNMLGNTMPGRLYIKKFLGKAVRAGCKYALIETTSQGAIYSRHKFIAWNAGVLTNLSPEHIESHGSFKKYREAKLSFLKYVLKSGGKVFINKDDKNSEFFIEQLHDLKMETYSSHSRGMEDLFSKIHPERQTIKKEDNDFLLSEFNRANAAAAVAVAREIGIGENLIEVALRDFKGVPGRMEFVVRKPFSVVVDYAHTPDSLLAVYTYLRKRIERETHPSVMISPKLICVLGAAGGGRDKWKRPEMGSIAAEYCDEIILTDEDPYDENPEEILEQISSGFSATSNKQQAIRKILDRREAIEKAISLVNEGDIVIITGKGSEDFIHVARGKKIPWSDRRVVEEILKEIG